MPDPMRERVRAALIAAPPGREVDAVMALMEPAGGVHVYLSTACWHAQRDDTKHLHSLCRMTCKWCAEQCRCTCHEEANDAG